jgi:predicted PurR-regulated permease PerM
MNNNHKEIISIGLTITIIIMAFYILNQFMTSLMWAAIIGISTYPLYERWRRICYQKHALAATSFTFILVVLLLMPLSLVVSILVNETQIFINYLQSLNRDGGQAPSFLQNLPFVGSELVALWNIKLGQPGYFKNILSDLNVSLTPFSYYIKQISFNLAHRSFQLGFTILTLFFVYRDGDQLFIKLNHVGNFCLGDRWFRYATKLPAALRATVNGTIVVGAGVGVLMGICYLLVGCPAPTLLGVLTAFGAMIPFVVPLIFVVVALMLVSGGKIIAAVVVAICGTVVMFVADHFVKPVLIGGATQLPFLAVLFGILGGVETLGLLGLFVGPIIMVLFITLWQESQGFGLNNNSQYSQS